MDSIYLGYPVGYLTVFQAKGDQSALAAWLEDGEARQDATGWLIDGQQRSTALCLIHDKKPRWFTDDEWADLRRQVLFDPASEKVRAIKLDAPRPRNSGVLVSELLRWGEDTIKEQYSDSTHRERLLRLRKQLQTSTVGEISFSGTAEQAVEIFKRLNQEGERVSSWDLTLTTAALARPDWVRDVVREGHREVRAAMPKLKLADLMRPFAARWQQTTRAGQLHEADWSDDSVSRAWEATMRGWREASIFLRSRGILVRGNVQVPVSYLLPLVVLFSLDAGNEELGDGPLWWLIGAMREGRYKSGSVNNIDAVAEDLVDLLTMKDRSAAMRYLWSKQGAVTFVAEDFLCKQPATQVLYQDLVVAMLTSRERDWSAQQDPMNPLQIPQQVHHIFPKDWVRQNLPDSRDAALWYANLTVISAVANNDIDAKSPRVYLSNPSGRHRTALADHFVTPEMVDEVTSNVESVVTMNSFLRARAEGMQAEANRQYKQARGKQEHK